MWSTNTITKALLTMTTKVPCAAESTRETKTYSIESVIRGHHVFKSIWSPFVGETLSLKQEKGNRHDRFAVAVIRRQSRPPVSTIVGRVPREFFQFFWTFLKDGGEITCEVTGKRKKAKGLEVPWVYTFTWSRETIIKLQTL